MKLFFAILICVLMIYAAEKRDTVTVVNCKCDTFQVIKISKVLIEYDTLKIKQPKAKPKIGSKKKK